MSRISVCGNMEQEFQVVVKSLPSQVAEDGKLEGCSEEDKESDCLWLVVSVV